MPHTLRRIGIAVAAAGAAAYATGAGLIWRYPDRFVGFPESEAAQPPGAAVLMIALAPDLGRGVETAVEHPADGVERGGPRVAQQLAHRSRRPLVPLLVIHGKRDDLVPPEMGITIYMRATAKNSLLLVHGETHSDAATVDTDAYQAALERLLPGPDRALAGARPRAAPSRAG
jgi:hypothetical protein